MAGSSNYVWLAKSLNQLAVVLSLAGTVFQGPAVWPFIEALVWIALLKRYSVGVASWLYWVGEIATYPLTYIAIRIALGVLVFVVMFRLNRNNR